MAEDSLFASDYDSLCSLCEEEGERPCLALGVNEQQKNENEEAELKRAHTYSFIDEEKKNESKNAEKEFVETDEEYNDVAEFEMGESIVEMTEENKSKHDDDEKGNDVSGDLFPPQQEEKGVLRLDSSGPITLMMVCEESVESSVNEGLLLCPDKSSTLSQPPLISSSPFKNPLPLTIPPSNLSVLQLQTQQMVQTQGSVPMPVPQAPCLTKPVYESGPSVEPKTLTHSGQLEMSLQQVYTTRRCTRFTSRSAPLKTVHPETSSQLLPCVSNNSLLAPAPKKKTRTSYSTDQLEELEKMFQDDHYPDADKRKEIAKSVGVTPQRVMVWFQNRRAKWRKTSKMTTRKPPVTRTQAPAQAPVHRPPIFTGPAIAPLPPQTGNTLPPYSTLLTRCTSPPGCVDVTTNISQGSLGDYKHPLMQSPPPLRRASLPFYAAYNLPTHTLSVLLDTPEHSEPQSFGMHTDIGFNYDSVGSWAKYESVASGPGNTQSYQLMSYPQQSQQPNSLLSQQSNNVLSQQPNTLLPQYSRMSYITPSPYLTPNSSEGTGTGSNLLPCANGGHAYFQCQNGSQILLQPGLQALQTYPWTSDIYSHPIQVPHPVLKPQFTSHGRESHFPPLVPPQSYITPQGASCPSLAKPSTPDPLLTSVKTELEETGHSQPGKVSEAETIFHCDFSPIHF